MGGSSGPPPRTSAADGATQSGPAYTQKLSIISHAAAAARAAPHPFAGAPRRTLRPALLPPPRAPASSAGAPELRSRSGAARSRFRAENERGAPRGWSHAGPAGGPGGPWRPWLRPSSQALVRVRRLGAQGLQVPSSPTAARPSASRLPGPRPITPHQVRSLAPRIPSCPRSTSAGGGGRPGLPSKVSPRGDPSSTASEHRVGGGANSTWCGRAGRER